MFTDESRFCIDSSDRRQRVYRRRGERFVVEIDRWGGQSVMVWAGFTHHHKTQLIFFYFGRGRGRGPTAQHYIDQVFHPIALPSIVAHPGTVLQQDNARPHAARLTQNCPFEHVWDYMKLKIRLRNVNNVQQLSRAFADEWNNLPVRFLRRLVGSISRRCTAVIRVHGGHTHY